jgi:hypothetical protein
VQIPPDQSRADRLVASVAIHWATGGCEAYTARKQAMRISTEIVSRTDADVFRMAEGNIRQQPLRRGCAEIGGVSSPWHVFKEAGREPKRAPHLLHLRRNASEGGEGNVQPRVDQRKHGRVAEQSYNLIVPMKVGNRRASARSSHGTHWREGGSRHTNLFERRLGLGAASGITGTAPMLGWKSSRSGQLVPETFQFDEAQPQSWNSANSGPPAQSVAVVDSADLHSG